MSEPLQVVVAVIRNARGQVLIARRPEHKPQGGLWEFPGGKREAGESAAVALARELREELDIGISQSQPLIRVQQPGLQLEVFEVTGHDGEPRGAEGQPLRWVDPEDLPEYAFPESNRAILAAVRLPDRYLITPQGLDRPGLLKGLRQALVSGLRLVQLRAPDMFDPDYRDMAVDAAGLCAGRARLMLKGPFEWLGDFPSAGWHLTASQLRRHAARGRPFGPERWLAACCHDEGGLKWAADMGVDLVTVSPVQPTASHPEAAPLGWEQAHALVARASCPVYLLGGLGPAELPVAREAGARGIAAIRGLWPAEC